MVRPSPLLCSPPPVTAMIGFSLGAMIDSLLTITWITKCWCSFVVVVVI